MKNLIKIALTLLIGIVMSVGIFRPDMLMGTPASTAIGNWYQQFLPNIGGRTILDITFLDSLIGYTITSISSDTSYILKTTNGGDDWFINYRAPSFIFRRVQFLNNNTGYVAGQNLIKTTNAGINWLPVNTSLFIEDIHFISNDTAWYTDPNSFAGGVFFTSNGGVNWIQQLNIGSQNPTNIYFYDKDTGFTAENTLYRTTNGGLNWILVPGGTGFSDMYFINSATGWKCYGPIQKTTNGGLNWSNQPIPQGGNILISQIIEFANIGIDTLIGVGSTIFTGSGNRGMICRSTNGGNNWTYQVPDSNINIFQYQNIAFTSRLQGWAYTGVTGIHTTSGGDPVWLTGINQVSSQIPKEYKLFQNYPNPFNPVTNIGFRISGFGLVTMKIFDISGRELITLINEELRAGEYKTDWNASAYSSGVYFYKMEVKDDRSNQLYTETKRMILIK